jgi:hypothetical protein
MEAVTLSAVAAFCEIPDTLGAKTAHQVAGHPGLEAFSRLRSTIKS